jgi:hypothetical protein
MEEHPPSFQFAGVLEQARQVHESRRQNTLLPPNELSGPLFNDVPVWDSHAQRERSIELTDNYPREWYEEGIEYDDPLYGTIAPGYQENVRPSILNEMPPVEEKIPIDSLVMDPTQPIELEPQPQRQETSVSGPVRSKKRKDRITKAKSVPKRPSILSFRAQSTSRHTKKKVHYAGRKRSVYVGSRGGRYVIVNGEKRYIHK